MRDCGNKIAPRRGIERQLHSRPDCWRNGNVSTAIYQDTQPTGIPRTPRHDRNQGRRHWRAICGVCSRSV